LFLIEKEITLAFLGLLGFLKSPAETSERIKKHQQQYNTMAYFSNSVIHSTAKLINFLRIILVHEQSDDNMTPVNASIPFFRYSE